MYTLEDENGNKVIWESETRQKQFSLAIENAYRKLEEKERKKAPATTDAKEKTITK